MDSMRQVQGCCDEVEVTWVATKDATIRSLQQFFVAPKDSQSDVAFGRTSIVSVKGA
jgi:hypothetical protein